MPRRPKHGYIENDEIRRLRTQVWFHVVQQRSQLSIERLEQKFSSGGLAKRWKSGIWNKYKKGDVTPRNREGAKGQRSLVQLVEAEYPGTKIWLDHPLWRALDPTPMEPSEIRKCYENLPSHIREVLIEIPPAGGRFWRTVEGPATVMRSLAGTAPLEKLYVAIMLLKESEACQDRNRFASAVIVLGGSDEWLKKIEELASFRTEISRWIECIKAHE